MKETGVISKTERARATAAYLAGPRPVVTVDWSMCTCSQHPYPHPPHREEKTVFDYHRSLQYVKQKHGRRAVAPGSRRVVPTVRGKTARGRKKTV